MSKRVWQVRSDANPSPPRRVLRGVNLSFQHCACGPCSRDLILAFAVLFCPAPAWAVTAAEQNQTCLACHGDKSMTAKHGRQGGFALRRWQEVYALGPRQRRLHRLPCRSRGQGLSAPHARQGQLRKLPLAGAGAVFQVPARQSGRARRPAGAALRQLSRQPRYPAGKGQAVRGCSAENSVRLRLVPSGRHAGTEDPRYRRSTTFLPTTPKVFTARACSRWG